MALVQTCIYKLVFLLLYSNANEVRFCFFLKVMKEFPSFNLFNIHENLIEAYLELQSYADVQSILVKYDGMEFICIISLRWTTNRLVANCDHYNKAISKYADLKETNHVEIYFKFDYLRYLWSVV